MAEKEKAIAYDKAIERAKKLYGNGIAEEIFPELKESKDEKIRKEIISILRNAYWTSNKNKFNELVAWLEKQGEPKLHWISVDDDLPCNYEELMSKYPLRYYKKQTVNVLTLLPNGSVATDSMGYRKRWWNGRQWDGEKWEWWSHRRPTHWFPISKLSKE